MAKVTIIIPLTIKIIIGINGLVFKGPFTQFPNISCENVWFPLDVSLHQAIDSKNTCNFADHLGSPMWNRLVDIGIGSIQQPNGEVERHLPTTIYSMDWCKENLQETMDCPMKYGNIYPLTFPSNQSVDTHGSEHTYEMIVWIVSHMVVHIIWLMALMASDGQRPHDAI